MAVSYSKKIQNNYFVNKTIIGLVGDYADLSLLISNLEPIVLKPNKKVKAIIGNNLDFIKALGLNETLLNLKVSELSTTDYKLISLINAVIIKPEVVILDNIELGINPKILTRIIRFLKTVQATFRIKVVIISRDAIFLAKTVKNIVVMKNEIIKYQGPLMPAIKQKLLPKPEIIKFIELANEKGAELEFTLDDKEILKSIYRSVR